MVTCDHDFCTSALNSQIRDCKSGFSCPFRIRYGDGTTTSGYFVKDKLLLDQVPGNFRTSSMTETVIFGCGAKESGKLGSSYDALDGILGLGQANTSMISQLAAAGKTKKMFAHCLDTKTGGGIFTIGEVVEPEIRTIPIIPNRTHYNVVLKDIEVGSEVLQTTTDKFDARNSREVIIDSGTTFSYLPGDIYHELVAKIRRVKVIAKTKSVDDSFGCFNHDEEGESNYSGFPTVKFNFEKSLTLTVHPSDYLFPLQDGILCLGWQSGGMKSENGKSGILLGAMALANKMVVYDLEDMAIGWSEYNCSESTARVKDGKGDVQVINAHNLSPAAATATATATHQHGGTKTTMTSFLLLILIVISFNLL